MMKLYTNFLKNPIGIDVDVCFSWQSDIELKTYRVILSLDETFESIIWCSGEQYNTDNQILLSKSILKSRSRYFWKLVYTDFEDNIYSSTSYFETAFLNEDEWRADWLSASSWAEKYEDAMNAPMFRKSFDAKNILQAKLYVSTLGYGEVTINGVRISDDCLVSPISNYNKTVWYNVYDVTSIIQEGHNVTGVVLGNGFYNEFIETPWLFQNASWRDCPKFIYQLEIIHTSNNHSIILSDQTWKVYKKGPITFDALRNGEYYDSRLETIGWNTVFFDDADWEYATKAKAPKGKLRSTVCEPIREKMVLEPVTFWQTDHGSWVFDFGQNISGWCRLNINEKYGTEITIKYGEMINNGCLETSNIDTFVYTGLFQTDKFICNGKHQIWSPKFTYHGFQYIEVIGLTCNVNNDTLKAVVVHQDIESRGTFSCSNELFNKIQLAARQATLCNMHWMPTDCPQREKNGWTGDAQLSAEQAMTNFSPIALYLKWLQDIKDSMNEHGQLPGIVPTCDWGYAWGNGPAFDAVLFEIPYKLYLYYGYKQALINYYPEIQKYMTYLSSKAKNNILSIGLGDWSGPFDKQDDYHCPLELTDTAYYAYFAKIASISAKLQSLNKDYDKYFSLYNEIRTAFREQFITKRRCKFDNQTAIAVILEIGLSNKDEEEMLKIQLKDRVIKCNGHHECGIIGARFILHALVRVGLFDYAYEMANKRDYPSWGNWIEQGATTLWETWNGQMSRNHHMFSDISSWFYKSLGGIHPDENNVGFKNILLKPQFTDKLSNVYAEYNSTYGLIISKWEFIGSKIIWDITIPNSCECEIFIPDNYYSDCPRKIEGGTFSFQVHKKGEKDDEVIFGTLSTKSKIN